MLVLTRTRDQSLIIGDDVRIKVVDVRGEKVRLGIDAPREVSVHRSEVYDQIQLENRNAARASGLASAPANQSAAAAVRIDPAAHEPFLVAAIDQARHSQAEGGFPAGAVLVRDGVVIGRGHHQRLQLSDPLAFAEIQCLRSAGPLDDYATVTLYTTSVPGFAAGGAAVQLGIRRVIAGQSVHDLNARGIGGRIPEMFRSHGVELIDLHDARCIEMIGQFLHDRPEQWAAEAGRRKE